MKKHWSAFAATLERLDMRACNAILNLLHFCPTGLAKALAFPFVALLAALFAYFFGRVDVISMFFAGALCAVWLAPLLYKRTLSVRALLVCSAVLSLAMGARMAVLSVISEDCRDYLLPWVNTMADMSFSQVMSTKVGDYTVIYQYLVFLFSRLPIDAVLLYKSFSFLFEGLLAYAIASLVCHVRGENARISRFALFYLPVFFIPTLLLNGAVWAQCDVIYAALALCGLLWAMEGHGARASIAFTLSLCFKLQAIFLLPILFLLLYWKKLGLRHVVLMAITFLAVSLPAMLGGKGVKAILAIYLYQMNEYKLLTLGAPSVYQFFNAFIPFTTEQAALCGVLFAFFCTALLLWLGTHSSEGSWTSAVLCALALCLCIPFFLPYMHERYFFLADMLCVVLVLVWPRRGWATFAVLCASLNGYGTYLFNRTWWPWPAATIAMACICCAGVYWYVQSLRRLPKSQ